MMTSASTGFNCYLDGSIVSLWVLSANLEISESAALEILKVASSRGSVMDGNNAIVQQEQQQQKQSHNPKDWIAVDPQNAWDLLHEERSLMTHITTSCVDLDDILGGGISCKQVTEIGGVPGIGKTQLGIQLAVNVQMPPYCGGLGGKAIYIDTEGSFMAERAQEIAEACVEDLSCPVEIQGKDVKIVIIDSIAFHFRQGFEDLALRTRILGDMALKLMKLAKVCSLAKKNNAIYVAVMPQVYVSNFGLSFVLLLSLIQDFFALQGDSWSRCCTNRVILYWNGNERYAYIDKSPYLRPAAASYSVTSRGIRNSASNCKRSRLV
ncbi:unnamed protein product [Dovyalis caffra]|uniref:DNA repair protein RAD51 homolog 3 n=1 Tax=Dovyalis caffra TaxID=77055 RepID=A0AAV1SBW1_9ROSI|nr:unnamed protein product [Dovyalis caffra]